MKNSKFDTQAHCEEIAPEFVPSHNDLIDSLPPEILEASYRKPANVGGELFRLFGGVYAAQERNAMNRREADVRGEAYLMTV